MHSSAPSTVNMHGSFRYDRGDKRAVAGNAQIILVGRVLGQVGTFPLVSGRARIPRTQFSVQVITSLKGNRTGQITVNQMGGRRADGTMYRFDNDPLLEAGGTYLLAGSYSASDHWYSLIPGVGTTKLSTDIDAARAAIGADPLVAEWRAAIADPARPKVARKRDPLPTPGAEGRLRLDTTPPATQSPDNPPNSSEPPASTGTSSSPKAGDSSGPPSTSGN